MTIVIGGSMQAQMYFLVLILWASLLASSGQNLTACNSGVVFYDHYYMKYKLFGSLNQPTNLVLDRSTDNLFFTHLDWKAYDIVKDTGASFKIVKCNITERTCTEISNITDGHAVAYDPMTRTIYLGGENGVYLYNRESQTVELLTDRDPNVRHIFIQRNFYIIREKKLYILRSNSTFVIVREARDIEIENFFVCRTFSIYYSNSSGLFKAKTTTSPVYLLSDSVRVSQIAQDYRRGGVFFAAQDGIYMDDILENKLIKVADIKRVLGITFRYVQPEGAKNLRTQVIYSDNRAIYLLNISKHSKYCMGLKNNVSATSATTPELDNTTPIDNSLFLKFRRKQ